MKIIVLLKQVPDLVEELEIAPEGTQLDTTSLRYIINEPDEHALEQAILLKEKYGGTVTAIILDGSDVDEILLTAFAKGADKVVKISWEWTGINSPSAARIFTSFIKSQKDGINSDTIILTGTQASDDLQGEIVTYLSEFLGIPSINVVTGVNLVAETNKIITIKEFSGGLRGEFELQLPCILGIQSAEKPPRYVPVAKVRAASKSAKIETFTGEQPEVWTKLQVRKLFKPETSGKAEMIEGSPEEIASKIVEILTNQGLI